MSQVTITLYDNEDGTIGMHTAFDPPVERTQRFEKLSDAEKAAMLAIGSIRDACSGMAPMQITAPEDVT